MYCRFIVLSFCCLMLGFEVTAQNTTYAKKGDACMKRADYAKAAAFYKKAADNNINDVSAKEKLAKAFMLLGDFRSAEAVYQLLATSPMAASINKFYYAQVLRINGKYSEAEKAYQLYFDEHPDDALAHEFTGLGKRIDTLLTDQNHYKLTNIPENSAGDDEGPTFCAYSFCYASNGHPPGMYDLFMLRGGQGNDAAHPQRIKGQVNKGMNEGPATFSRNGLEMIFTRSNYGHKATDKTYKLGLYHATYDTVAKKWINITQLPFIDYNYNYMQPSLSKDGSQLFFVSDRKGGLGETDIYVCHKTDSAWGAPVNLGTGVNTMGEDETPFMADDGTLYFSSNSRFGIGGMDIYAASLTDTVWGNVVNPGVPLNSPYNDFGYVSDPNARTGYIVSDRPGGMGGNDIYHYTFNGSLVCGTLLDAKTQKPVADATVTLTANDGPHHQAHSKATGEFCFQLAAGKAGVIEVSKTGYATVKQDISGDSAGPVIILQPVGSIAFTVNILQQGSGSLQNAVAGLFNPATGETVEKTSDSTGTVVFNMEPNQEYVLRVSKFDVQNGSFERFVRPISTIGLKSGQTLKEEAQLVYHERTGLSVLNAEAGILPNVYFGVGSYSLSSAAKKELDKIVVYMKASPAAQVVISSNTDASGNIKTNMALSAKRALACLNYLVAKGIYKKRFIAVGYGEKNLVNKCTQCTEAEQAQNRRTEFRIIKP